MSNILDQVEQLVNIFPSTSRTILHRALLTAAGDLNAASQLVIKCDCTIEDEGGGQKIQKKQYVY